MIERASWSGESLRAMARARSAFGPLASVDEIMRGADLYEYQDGASRAFVAVRPVILSGGTRLDIVGLASVGQRLAAHPFHAALDALADDYGAQIMACMTQVPHVAKSCQAHGYAITGAVLTKNRGMKNG